MSPIDYEKGMPNENMGGDMKDPAEGARAELRFDPMSVQGMKDYQPGDKVILTVEATMGDPSEDGMTPFTVDRIEAESINPAKKSTRDMMSRKPDMAGTNIGKSPDEEAY